MKLHSGQIELSKITNERPLLLFHGGAGPSDPQGERALSARREMESVSRQISTASAGQEWSDFLHQTHRTPLTQAEQWTLHTVKQLELNPMFNAGRGAALQEDGQVRLSASFMESTRQVFSAVVNVQHILHPSELVYYLQNERYTMRDGNGARNLAHRLEIPVVKDLITPERYNKWLELKKNSQSGSTGTVGAVTLTHKKELAACTSTGGVGHEPAGRMGDTPTVSGNYCSTVCAISCTGIGEQINNLGVARAISLLVEEGATLKIATQKILTQAESRNFRLAIIAVALTDNGAIAEWCAASTAPTFIWAGLTPEKVLFFNDHL